LKNPENYTKNNSDSENIEDGTLKQVFILIRKGIQLVDINKFIEGIDCYKKAINLMKSTSGFENEIEKVEKLLEDAYNSQDQYFQKIERISEDAEKMILTKEDQLAAFERKRKKEEEVSREGYDLLEKGTILFQCSQFDEALEKYVLAIEKFKEINWISEISKVYQLIKELNEKRESYLKQLEVIKKEERQKNQIREKEKEIIMQHQEFQKMSAELKKVKVDAFQQQKIKEEKISAEAYNLLGEASKLEEEYQFDKAREKYQLAIEKFKEINWVSEIPKINQLIKDLNEKKEVLLRGLGEKMKDKKIRKRITEKEQEFLMQYQEFQKMFTETKMVKLYTFQQQKRKEEKLSSEAYNLLGEGYKLEEKNQFNEAMKKYQLAIEKFKEINWASEIPKVNQLIDQLQIKQKKYLELFIKEKEEILSKIQKNKFKEIEQIKEDFLLKIFDEKEKNLKELKEKK